MADDATILRVLTFRTVGAAPALDVVLRDESLPALEAVRGLVDAYAARHGTAETGDRVIVTTWTSRRAMTDTFGAADDLAWLAADHLDQTRDARAEVYGLRFGFRLDRPAPPRVLRLFRGHVRQGELDAYVDDVHVGAMRDAQAIEGMLALYVGVEPPDRFATVSVWADWESIEEATGSSVQRPASTRDASRLVDATATHYEVLPDTDRPRRASALDLTAGS